MKASIPGCYDGLPPSLHSTFLEQFLFLWRQCSFFQLLNYSVRAALLLSKMSRSFYFFLSCFQHFEKVKLIKYFPKENITFFLYWIDTSSFTLSTRQKPSWCKHSHSCIKQRSSPIAQNWMLTVLTEVSSISFFHSHWWSQLERIQLWKNSPRLNIISPSLFHLHCCISSPNQKLISPQYHTTLVPTEKAFSCWPQQPSKYLGKHTSYTFVFITKTMVVNIPSSFSHLHVSVSDWCI